MTDIYQERQLEFSGCLEYEVNLKEKGEQIIRFDLLAIDCLQVAGESSL